MVTGDFHAFFFVHNLLTWAQTEVRDEENKEANYWLAPTGSQGEFILDLESVIIVYSVEIVNTHHAGMRTRSTRELEVWLSLEFNGPWELLGSYILPDSRNDPDPGILHKYVAEVEPPPARFVRFRLISYHGDIGGGVQYFAVKSSQINKITTINTTTSTSASTTNTTMTTPRPTSDFYYNLTSDYFSNLAATSISQTTPSTSTKTATSSLNITTKTTEATTTQTTPALTSSSNESRLGNPVGREGKSNFNSGFLLKIFFRRRLH